MSRWNSAVAAAATVLLAGCAARPPDRLKAEFFAPPDAARPGVYWYFMDGNLNREAMTADLESMKEAGLGYALFLEVNVGVPRGRVDFLSGEWQDLFAHAVHEAERLGIRLIVGSGPGWAGSGGPWVKPAESMKHLVASATEVRGPGPFRGKLPVPEPVPPFFGEENLTPGLKELRAAWYEDAVVLAFPTPKTSWTIPRIAEKALYERAPYTSQPGVLPYLAAPAAFVEPPGAAIDPARMVDLTGKLLPDGGLDWDVPPGDWTVLRFGTRNNGSVTRPAPLPGLGFECDKFDGPAFDAHYDAYIGKLLRKAGRRPPEAEGGWSMIHIDSWEMGAQNWSPRFREEFRRRRGYDLFSYLPALTGRIVGSLEKSERFLWDLRKTASELVIENHALRFKELGRREGLRLSIEPYDMNPASDLDLGARADVPMGEFWTEGHGFNSAFSVLEAVSIAHVIGAPVAAAESFTADDTEAWKKFPGNMKSQGDWAFAAGLNRLLYHTFIHNPLGGGLRPGMTMGPYGVHWDRGQTWWPMVPAYHLYIARCQHLLSRGKPVSDILYLTPEGAPQVFRPPASALEGTEWLPDKRGFSFDGCSPVALMNLASVKDGRLVFPGGASYAVLVMPAVETMTPGLLSKIEALVEAGAIVIGGPPVKSPSLEDYPACDAAVSGRAGRLWGSGDTPKAVTGRPFGLGRIYWGGNLTVSRPADREPDPRTDKLYPEYAATAALLESLGMRPDFVASGGIRYTHRSLEDREVYFVSNRTAGPVTDICIFRDGTPAGELWDAVTGETRPALNLIRRKGGMALPVRLETSQSLFVVFDKNETALTKPGPVGDDFRDPVAVADLEGPWAVAFDPAWGGPERVVFERLDDWSKRPEEGIRHYSGIATYSIAFDRPGFLEAPEDRDLFLDLGVVRNMARVRLNGKDLGVVWTAPWRVRITDTVRDKGNRLEIEIANLWINRLIGDEAEPWDGVEDGRWPAWLLEGKPRPSRRFAFAPRRFYEKDDPLFESGLLGPVRLMLADR